jgi:hypothetical protein
MISNSHYHCNKISQMEIAKYVHTSKILQVKAENSNLRKEEPNQIWVGWGQYQEGAKGLSAVRQVERTASKKVASAESANELAVAGSTVTQNGGKLEKTEIEGRGRRGEDVTIVVQVVGVLDAGVIEDGRAAASGRTSGQWGVTI